MRRFALKPGFLAAQKAFLVVIFLFVSLPAAPSSAAGFLIKKTHVIKKKGFSESQLLLATCASHGSSSRVKQRESQSHGTMFVLHGSGGANSLEQLLESVRSSACQHGYRLALPAAPTQNKNWPFETANGEGQDRFLLELIQKDLPSLFKLTRIEVQQPIFLLGVSAGATFLMGDFYPRHGHQLRGHALALCGGSWPSQDKIEGVKSVESRFPLFVQIGKGDFLFRQVQAGLSKYAEMGLPLRASFTDEPGHCAFDFNRAIEEVLSSPKSK